MRFGLYAGVLAFTVLGSPAAPQKPAVSQTSQQAETLRHFRALVQIDTSNPPGNEVKIVEYLEKVLASSTRNVPPLPSVIWPSTSRSTIPRSGRRSCRRCCRRELVRT